MPAKPCPYCGRENPPEARACPACGTSFPAESPVPALPGVEPDARSVVLRTFSSQMNAELVAQHLEEAGIRVLLTADDAGGTYPSLHAAYGTRLLIKVSDLTRAELALREMEEAFGIKAEGKCGDVGIPSGVPAPARKPAPHLAKLGFLLLGAVMGALSHYAWTVHRSLYTGTDDRDFNRDWRADAWWTYRRGELISSSLDRNFDGKPDATTFQREGWATTAESDENFDGKPDTWWSYTNEVIALIRFDADFDGKLDGETRWEFGRPVETRYAASNQLGYWRRDFWTNYVLRESWLDRDRDGALDERQVFDAFGTFLRVEPMK